VECANACRAVNDFVVSKRKLKAAEGCTSEDSYQSMIWNFVEWNLTKGSLQSGEIHWRGYDFHVLIGSISQYFYGAFGSLIGFIEKRNVGVNFLPLCRSRLPVRKTTRVKDCETG